MKLSQIINIMSGLNLRHCTVIALRASLEDGLMEGLCVVLFEKEDREKAAIIIYGDQYLLSS